MITQKPDILLGTHYGKIRVGTYCFQSTQPWWVKLDVPVPDLSLLHNGREIARFQDGWLMMHAGYAWNGCSPKIRFMWFILGTPDPPCTHVPSGVHDLFYQFLKTPGFPLTQEQCDDSFFDLMSLFGFRLKGLYHYAVNKLGGRFARLDPLCSVEPYTPQNNESAPTTR